MVVVIVLLFSAMVLAGFVSSVSANPFEYRATATPIVTIHAPINGTCANAVFLNFTVSKPEAWAGTEAVDGMLQYLSSVVIEIDGNRYGWAGGFDDSLSSPFEYAASLTNLTEGLHNLTVRANAYGFSVEAHGLWKYSIPLNSSSAVYFTLDTTMPLVSIVSLESKTYDSADLPLNFTLDEPCSKVSYVLDGYENVTVTGNSSLSGLPVGEHNITIYVWDNSGNVGASKTVTFKVEEPFPTTLVIGVSSASVGIITVGLLLYFKKRRH